MVAAEIRRAIEGCARGDLPGVTALLWRAFGDGGVSEAEAAELSALIENRTLVVPAERALPRVGSRPRSGESMARRRRWAAAGRMPPGIAARFTLAEQAALAVVAQEATQRGSCALSIGHIAAAAGVSESTVRNALRFARLAGLVTVEERRVARYRNDTNVVRIVDAAWMAWLRLARSGCKSPQGTSTGCSRSVDSVRRHGRKGCRQEGGDGCSVGVRRIRGGGGHPETG
ncbi:helix-turn-helix domain-containing protein [Methylobacterium sp. 285MFTsu5.1]|uniref:helix-turn-helix domain-containing protein n=1 Tax=Methylobacterium sp. 285MFTsu5.1 TaxID=1172187 RepID=UPI00036566D3|nr:helix-turn-helix domain-containing protein [Methylobacterium sp. 285MFTsu5.1]